MLNMPKLHPIPIETKNQPFYIRLWRWITTIRKWELLEDWQYTLRDGTSILIPQGFKFDGASIPRPLWGLLSPVGLLLIPGLIHDYAYKFDELIAVTGQGDRVPYKPQAGRNFWDRLFLDVAIDVNGFALIDTLAWAAISLFGWIPWKKRREQELKPAHGA